MKSLLPTENEIQKSIIDYLKLKGWYVQRMQSGAMKFSYGGKSGLVRMSAPGTPDIMAFKGEPHPMHYLNLDGTISKEPTLQLYFIEVKRSKKHRATELQVAKMKELEAHGAKCLIATSIEDLKAEGL